MSGFEEIALLGGIAGVAYLTKNGKVIPIPGSGTLKMPVEVEFRPFLFRHVILPGASATLFTIKTRPANATVMRLFGQNWFANSKWRLIQSDGKELMWEHQLAYLFSPLSLNQPISNGCSLTIENNDSVSHSYNVAFFLESAYTSCEGFTDGPISSASMPISTAPNELGSLGFTTVGTITYPPTTLGNTTSVTAAGISLNVIAAVKKFTTTAAYTVTSLSLYVYAAAAGKCRLGIYGDSGGSPAGQNLYCQTAELTFAGTGYLTGTLTTPGFLPIGSYWLTMILDTTNGNNFYYTAAAGSRYYNAQAYGVMPATFPAAPTNDAVGDFRFYAIGVQIEGYIKGNKYQFVGTANSQVQSFVFHPHASGTVRLSLFTDDGGSPSKPLNKLWESGSMSVTVDADFIIVESAGARYNAWNGTLINGAWYWILWQWETVGSGPSYTLGSTNVGVYVAQAYGAFPLVWAGGTNSTEQWTLYLKYGG